MDFNDSEQLVDGVPVLQVGGDVDLRSAAVFEGRLAALLERRPSRVVLDLTRVDFFDSTGLHVLNAWRRQAEQAGIATALVCVESRLLRLLQITGLDTHFAIFDDVDQAVHGAPQTA